MAGDKEARFVQVEIAAMAGKKFASAPAAEKVQDEGSTLSSLLWRREAKRRQIKGMRPLYNGTALAVERNL